jgi:hypothetical protein
MTKKHKAASIYARASTDKQKVEMQLNELRQFVVRSDWTGHRQYVGQSYTGANTNRPAFTGNDRNIKADSPEVMRLAEARTLFEARVFKGLVVLATGYAEKILSD